MGITFGSPDEATYRTSMEEENQRADYAKFGTPFAHSQMMGSAIQQGMGTNRVAPQLGVGGEFRQGQQTQIGQLQGIASGQQQGAGEIAAQRQVQNALASQQAMARMNRGASAGMASRSAARNSAGIGLAGAGMGQQAALQDQQMAQAQLTQALGQGRGQDSQLQLANLDAQLRQMGMDDASRLGYLDQLTKTDMFRAQLAEQNRQSSLQAEAERNKNYMNALSSGAGIMSGMAMSDERVKEDISDATDEIDEMLEHLKPKRYTYKNQERHGIGSRVGIMAQDLERSKAGKRVVVEVPDGKALDVNKALSASLASVARLHSRLRKLESKAA